MIFGTSLTLHNLKVLHIRCILPPWLALVKIENHSQSMKVIIQAFWKFSSFEVLLKKTPTIFTVIVSLGRNKKSTIIHHKIFYRNHMLQKWRFLTKVLLGHLPAFLRYNVMSWIWEYKTKDCTTENWLTLKINRSCHKTNKNKQQ